MAVFHRRLWVKKDKKARLNFEKIETNRLVLRSLLANRKQSLTKKIYYSRLFNK